VATAKQAATPVAKPHEPSLAEIREIQKAVDRYPGYSHEGVNTALKTIAHYTDIPRNVAIGIMGAESFFDPNRKVDGGSALGLFQYTKDQWPQSIVALNKTELGQKILQEQPQLTAARQILLKDPQHTNKEAFQKILELRKNPEIIASVWSADAQNSWNILKGVHQGIKGQKGKSAPTAGEMWLTNIVAPAATGKIVKASANGLTTLPEGILRDDVLASNPLLRDKGPAEIIQMANNETSFHIKAHGLLASNAESAKPLVPTPKTNLAAKKTPAGKKLASSLPVPGMGFSG
jgi:hypothetical protein